MLKHMPWIDEKRQSDDSQFITHVIANSQIESYLADMNKYMRGK